MNISITVVFAAATVELPIRGNQVHIDLYISDVLSPGKINTNQQHIRLKLLQNPQSFLLKRG